jgi:hypothetical protein
VAKGRQKTQKADTTLRKSNTEREEEENRNTRRTKRKKERYISGGRGRGGSRYGGNSHARKYKPY